MLELISKCEAKKAGLRHYFTGNLCPKGHVSKRYVSGGHCFDCIKEKTEKRKIWNSKWQKRNKEKCAKYSAEYRKRNPESAAKYMVKLRLEKREELQEQERKRYQKNKQKFVEKGKIYRKNNPEVFATHARNRRALLKGSEGIHTKEEVLDLLKKQNYECANCLKNIQKRYTADHIICLKKGGSNYINNIQILCISCNSKKGTLDPTVFAKRNGRLV